MTISVDIRKRMGDFLLDVNFETGNEVLALLGASGCGKSMTLKCLAGVLKPDEGRIVLDGRVLFDSRGGINLPPQERRVGLLFQNYALFPNMTVEGNILTVLRKERRERRRVKLAALLEKFYLQGLESHYPSQLSGGQQQRVALARILASDPSLVMLDEPLSALDTYLRWQLEAELVRLLEQFEGTTLYVSHNRSEVYRICRKVCVMHQGISDPVCGVAELFEKPGTLPAALLSGCQNYSRIERLSPRAVFALDWGVELTCGDDVTEDSRYIGVRAHSLNIIGGPGENAFACNVLRKAEDVFETILIVSPGTNGSGRANSNIRIELPKDAVRDIREGDDLWVTVRPDDVMLLRHRAPARIPAGHGVPPPGRERISRSEKQKAPGDIPAEKPKDADCAVFQAKQEKSRAG